MELVCYDGVDNYNDDGNDNDLVMMASIIISTVQLVNLFNGNSVKRHQINLKSLVMLKETLMPIARVPKCDSVGANVNKPLLYENN